MRPRAVSVPRRTPRSSFPHSPGRRKHRETLLLGSRHFDLPWTTLPETGHTGGGARRGGSGGGDAPACAFTRPQGPLNLTKPCSTHAALCPPHSHRHECGVHHCETVPIAPGRLSSIHAGPGHGRALAGPWGSCLGWLVTASGAWSPAWKVIVLWRMYAPRPRGDGCTAKAGRLDVARTPPGHRRKIPGQIRNHLPNWP